MGVRLDILFYYPGENGTLFHQVRMKGERGQSRQSFSGFALSPAQAFGMAVHVPHDVDRYLREGYGNFMEMRSKRDKGPAQWDAASSPLNMRKGRYSIAKTLRAVHGTRDEQVLLRGVVAGMYAVFVIVCVVAVLLAFQQHRLQRVKALRWLFEPPPSQ